MKPSVDVETSVIGYLAQRPSALLVTAANQKVTREFWDDPRARFELFVAIAVFDACRAGDAETAPEREAFLE